jgi:hypothetical protein
MRKLYYNAEHYPDPTAYYALINILREERRHELCVNCRSHSFTHVNCCMNCVHAHSQTRLCRRPRKPHGGYYPFKEAFEHANYIPS